MNIKMISKASMYLYISLFSGVSVYMLSIVFQRMAYWGESLYWYWGGAMATYLVGLLGWFFLIASIKSNKINLFYIAVHILSSLLLLTGFIWVTFIIIMGFG
ncbi:hypothetical protein [Alkalibacterium sp. AK22]|uniref:hypothetical protein n=1 Tax=Alkalibacterium sp. AK22 TaxID=1229520 RepID=UPI0006851612|nr:hypothetical protein [Alkalibacterium sp. AK22]